MKSASDFPTINAKVPDGLKDDGSKYRILLVDDSIFVKKQLQQMLLSQDYEVVDIIHHSRCTQFWRTILSNHDGIRHALNDYP